MEKLHPIEFPIEETRLLRALAKVVEETEESFPGSTPNAIVKAYENVRSFYAKQLMDEEYLMTTFHNPKISELIY